MIEVRKTVCNRDCPDACAIVAHVDTDSQRIVKIRGDKDHPVTRGFLCWRTSHYLETQYAPDRLTTPMLRREDGSGFDPISWAGRRVPLVLPTLLENLRQPRDKGGHNANQQSNDRLRLVSV